MRNAPAPVGRQAFDFQHEEVEVVGAGGEPFQQLLALADVQGRLDPRMARAEARDQARRGCAHLGLDREAQALGLRLAKRRELRVGADQAVDQLAAGLVQRVPGARQAKAPALLLEQRHLERRRELLQLQRDRGLGEVQLPGRARDAAQAGDGFEHEKLGQQPMAEESTRMRAGHLGSCSVTEVSLAAPRLEPAGAAGMTGDVLRIDGHPAESYSPAGEDSIPEFGNRGQTRKKRNRGLTANSIHCDSQ